MNTTYDRLESKYGFHMNTGELSAVLKYKTPQSLLEQVRRGKFPIRTFKLAGKRVADTRDVADYIDHQRETA